MKKKHSLHCCLSILGAALFCTPAISLLAATINVTSTADSGNGTLRAALASAADGDTINATGVSGTILLTSGQLSVTNSVTILGPGPGSLAVNGKGSSRVFYIGPELVVTISSLTITNGFVSGADDAGAGILNDHSTLTVGNCAFRGNQGGFGGAIHNDGYLDGGTATLIVSSTTFSSNSASYAGGAIGTQGGNANATASLINCTFNGNHSGPFYGGAILNDGAGTDAMLALSNCIFSGNWTDDGGAGGAIANLDFGVITAINSTFTNNLASEGGAVFNGGDNSGNATLTLTNCTVTGNSANGGGGVYNSAQDGIATLQIISSTIMSNLVTDPNGGGGAMYNDGGFSTNSAPLIIALNSTISGNSGAYGGAIRNDGRGGGNATVTVSNCTFRANSAGAQGGLIYNDGTSSGNAIFSLVASTVSSNSASDIGGAILNYGRQGTATTTLLNSTFSGNSANNGGGVIYNDGFSGSAMLNIGSTILSAGALGTNISNNAGSIVSMGYNLSSDGGSSSLTNTTDQVGNDPKLGPLQDNGGPTFTHALLTNSPAIDKGKNFSGLTTDQRGLPRPADLPGYVNANGGDGSDIGAFEVQLPVFNFTVLNTNDSGTGSLRAAIAGANGAAGLGTGHIDFAPGVTGTITLTTGELTISNTVVILGPGAASLTVNANYPTTTNRVFRIAPSNTVTIAGLTIANGYVVGKGGGIYNQDSTLTVSNCTLTGNYGGNGGGIYSDGEGQGGLATLTVINSTLKSNSSDVGGAIYNDGFNQGHATLTLVNSTVSGNSVGSWGGGLYNDANSIGNATIIVANSTLSGNSAGSRAAGIYTDGSGSGNAILTVANSTLSGNSANASAIYIDGSSSGSSAVELGNTILNAGPSGTNLVNVNGTVTSRGYNLSSDNGGGFLTNSTDRINLDPKLGPLQNNGGPTFTHALLAGSPATDQGKRNAIPSLAVNTDQRGFPRPVDLPGIASASGGDGSDIGAFETQLTSTPILLTGPQKPLNGAFQFAFTNTPGASFTVLTSTNIALPLNNWTVQGAPTEISPGHFQYSDSTVTNPKAFYRIRSP